MIDFKEILDYCQAIAIANKISPDEAAIYRTICRSYSRTFNTPLNQVFTLDPEHVILNVYEDQMRTLDDTKYENLEKMMDIILSIEDPAYERIKESKLAKDIEKYEQEEEDRVKSGKAIHPSLQKYIPKKTLLENEEENTEKQPTGGSVDFSSLKDSEEN